MNHLMKEYGLPNPEYEEIAGNFLVTFKKKNIVTEKILETKSVSSLSQVCPKSVPSGIAIKILTEALSASPVIDSMEVASNTNRTRFRNQILKPLIKAKLIKMTIPDSPKSSKQKYVITEKGRKLLNAKNIHKEY